MPDLEQPEANPEQERRLKQALRVIVGDLEREADDRVSKRNLLERRWLEDLRQLNSEYEADILKNLQAAHKSELFINQTRPKANACEARLTDMLFPTDQENWEIGPTPVPELVDAALEAVGRSNALVEQAKAVAAGGDEAQGRQLALQGEDQAKQSAAIKAQMKEAEKRSKAMSAEMKDQLNESGYNIVCRDVIRDACRIGTGIVLGPVGTSERTRRAWKSHARDDSRFSLEMVEDTRPSFQRVDPWGWFPQSDATCVEESESFFQRELKTPKSMRRLAREAGFDPDSIRRVLKDGPTQSLPVYVSELRAIQGDNVAQDDKRFVVWCYRGPLEVEQLRVLCECAGEDVDGYGAGEEIDPLTEVSVVLWFCQGEVLKFGIHHLDSDEVLYSVFTIEEDASSIWGFGIPYIMRNSQKAMNAAWRMMMDNSALASGPQVEIDTSIIDPADDDWSITPWKVWLRKKNARAGVQGFSVHNIDSNQAELANIIEMAKTFIDDETAISVLSQGEQGATTKTMGGMAILMNSANVVFRRMVKSFDDNMTIPNIRRLYDWNMQFSKKEHIKGDYEVAARGSGALLAREVQSQNLLLALQYVNPEEIARLLKVAPLLRKTFQSMMLSADEVVRTDDEIREEDERLANEPPPPDPELVKLEFQQQIAQLDADTRIAVAEMERDTRMMTLAETLNMSADKLAAMLESARMKTDGAERLFAAEAGIEERNLERGVASPSGGSLSVVSRP